MKMSAKVIVFLGPPGSGKGTQAARLSTALGIPTVSTGEMLRRECQSGSDLGNQVQNVLASGRLVSDDLINRTVANRLLQRDCELGCILDGYPRTVAQAQHLDSLLANLDLPAPVIFDFEVSCEEVVARLDHRRQCVQRTDDHPATVRERLRLYEENAAEMIRYYQARRFHRIQASGLPDEIFDEIIGALASYRPAPVLSGATGNALSRACVSL